MTRVVLAGSDSAWGPLTVEAIATTPGMTLVRTCADMPDLMAAAVAGLADVALVDGALSGIDLDSVSTLRRAGVRVVAVAASPDARDWLAHLGVDRAVAPAADVATWRGYLEASANGPLEADAAAGRGGELVAVWGPVGAPGRTTLAVALAVLAAPHRPVRLVDLDPTSASVAQHLGLIDEQSGVLAAVRAAQGGSLDAVRLGELWASPRPSLEVLTGTARPDQWIELRQGALEALLAAVRIPDALVVIDAGADPCTGGDPSGGPVSVTRAALQTADRVVVVGGADAISLGRLLRALRLLGEQQPATPVDVVVNRVRPTLGWSTAEVVELVARAAPGSAVHVLPDDVAAADRALLQAKSPAEDPSTALGAEMARVAAAIVAVADAAPLPTRPRSRLRVRR